MMIRIQFANVFALIFFVIILTASYIKRKRQTTSIKPLQKIFFVPYCALRKLCRSGEFNACEGRSLSSYARLDLWFIELYRMNNLPISQNDSRKNLYAAKCPLTLINLSNKNYEQKGKTKKNKKRKANENSDHRERATGVCDKTSRRNFISIL